MRFLTLSSQFYGGLGLGYAGLYTATTWIAEMFTKAGVEVLEIGFGNDDPSCAHRVSVSVATSMLVAGQIDAIYSQYVEAGAPFDLAAMSPRVIPVLSVGHDLFNAMPSLRAYLSSSARHPSDAVVISSEAGAHALRRMVANAGWTTPTSVDICVLPLGIAHMPEEQCNSYLENGEVTFLWIGRFSETYKADLRPLLLAFREIVHRIGPGLRLILVGADVSGSAERLQIQAKQIGVDAYCTWYPNATTEVLDACFACADVLVNVSDHVQETFGIVNLEAMARGIPVIAGAWSGFREVIVPGKTGFLVPMTLDASLLAETIGDPHGSVSLAAAIDIPALVDAMMILSENAQYRREMGVAGRRRVEKVYTTDVLAPQYVDFVEERITLAQSGRPRGNPRAWMPTAFSHYGIPAKGTLTKGIIESDSALEIVPDSSLRRAMIAMLQRWHRGTLETITGIDRVALATLIKLGVLRWSDKEDVKL